MYAEWHSWLSERHVKCHQSWPTLPWRILQQPYHCGVILYTLIAMLPKDFHAAKSPAANSLDCKFDVIKGFQSSSITVIIFYTVNAVTAVTSLWYSSLCCECDVIKGFETSDIIMIEFFILWMSCCSKLVSMCQQPWRRRKRRCCWDFWSLYQGLCASVSSSCQCLIVFQSCQYLGMLQLASMSCMSECCYNHVSV